MGAGEAPPAPTATGVLSRDPRQQPVRRDVCSCGRPCVPNAAGAQDGQRGSVGGAALSPLGGEDPGLTRWREELGDAKLPARVWGACALALPHRSSGGPCRRRAQTPCPASGGPAPTRLVRAPLRWPVAEQKPAAAWPPATGVFPRSASRVPTRLCPAPSFTSDVAQTLSGPQKAPPDSDRGGTPRGRGERCGPVQSSCVPFLFSLITIVFLILKSCSRKGSDTVTFKWRLKAARSQAVGRRGALSSQKQARILGRNPGQQGVCPAGGGTGAETREGPAQGQEWRERGVTPAGATEAGLRGTPGEQPWAPVPVARMEVRGLPGMAARLSHLRRFPRKSQRQEAAPRCAPWAWLAGGANGEAPPHRRREAPQGLSAGLPGSPGGRLRCGPAGTCANRPDCLGTARRSPQQPCEPPHLLTPAVT